MPRRNRPHPLPRLHKIATFTNIVMLADLRELLGHLLAYAHCEEEGRSASAAKRLTGDEVRSIASNIARLPDLLGAREKDRQTRECETRPEVSLRHGPH